MVVWGTVSGCFRTTCDAPHRILRPGRPLRTRPRITSHSDSQLPAIFGPSSIAKSSTYPLIRLRIRSIVGTKSDRNLRPECEVILGRVLRRMWVYSSRQHRSHRRGLSRGSLLRTDRAAAEGVAGRGLGICADHGGRAPARMFNDSPAGGEGNPGRVCFPKRCLAKADRPGHVRVLRSPK